jgi:two-component system chemotaxis response regulator CheB
VTALRVVVIEDSIVQRAHLVDALRADGDITVVGEAATADEALEVVQRSRPDVVTIDLLLAGGVAQQLIEKIMAAFPTPILVLAATDTSGRPTAADEAIAAGALRTLTKPERWTPADDAALRRAVRSLRGVVVIRHPRGRIHTPPPRPPRSGRPLVAIAASTGGPAALSTIFAELGPLEAPVIVVQHLHPDFVDSFASWMQRVSPLEVVTAAPHMAIQPGRVYVAPGGVHLRVGPSRRIVLSRTPDTIHRPSADELFLSVAEHVGADAIGVILTGIGDDGARGLLALAAAGGRTLGQDEASSAVYGMPRAAGALGAVQQFLDPSGIARALRRLVAERGP